MKKTYKNYGTFLAFGDSLTFGSRDKNKWSYPVYLSQLVEKKYNHILLFENAGIPSEISSEAMNRAFKLLNTTKCYEILFFEGTNDAKDSINTSLDVYKYNIEYIVKLSLIQNKKLYLGLIPDLLGFGAQDYSVRSQKRIDNYNKVILKIANDYEIPLVDFRNYDKKYYHDGVHLNSEGYKKMAQSVLEVLEKERRYEK